MEVDLEGAGVFESELISVARHTFDAGDTLLPGHAVVVFGGGSPAVGPTNSIWVAADNLGDPGSPGYLHLDPLGDVIELRNAAGDTVVELGYGNKVGGAPNANIDQSITLDPQLTGTTYSPHSDVASDPAALYSPGTLADGATF